MLHNVMNTVAQRENGYEASQYEGSCYGNGFTPYPSPTFSSHNSRSLPQQQQQQQQQQQRMSAASASTNAPQASLSAAHHSILSNLFNVQSTAPVFSPSLPTPYPLFVDVTTGAPMRLSEMAPRRETECIVEQYRYTGPQRPRTETPVYADQMRSPMMSAWQPMARPMNTVSFTQPMSPATSPLQPSMEPQVEARPATRLMDRPAESEPQTPAHTPAQEPTTVPKPMPTEGDFNTPARNTMSKRNMDTVEKNDALTPVRRPLPQKQTTPTTATKTAPAAPTTAVTAAYQFELTGRYPKSMTAVGSVAFEEGTAVIVEGDRGIDLAFVRRCVRRNGTAVRPSGGHKGNPIVLRVATTEDVEQWNDLRDPEREALEECQMCVTMMGLGYDMRVVNAVYQFDREKLTFYYQTKLPRVDFRKLLNELFTKFRCRIWMEKDESE